MSSEGKEREKERGRKVFGVLLLSSMPTHNHNSLILKARILKVFNHKELIRFGRYI